MNLKQKVDLIKSVGKKTAGNLKEDNIKTYKDLLERKPIRYEIISKVNLNDQINEELILISGVIKSKIISIKVKSNTNAISFDLLHGNKLIQILVLGNLELRFRLNEGQEVTLYGVYNLLKNTMMVKKIFLNVLDDYIKPIYNINNISCSSFSNYVSNILETLENVEDYIPIEFLNKDAIISKYEYYKLLHFPTSKNDLVKVFNRYKYEYYYNILKAKPNDVDIKKEDIIDFVRTVKDVSNEFLTRTDEIKIFDLILKRLKI